MSRPENIDLRWGPLNAIQLSNCERLVHFIAAFIEPQQAPNDDSTVLGHYYALAVELSHDAFHDYLPRVLNEKTHIRNAIFKSTLNPDGFAGEYSSAKTDLTPAEKMIVAVYCVNEIKNMTSKDFQESVFNVVKGKNKLPDEDDERIMRGISVHSYFLVQFPEFCRWAVNNGHTQKGRHGNSHKNWDDDKPTGFGGFFFFGPPK